MKLGCVSCLDDKHDDCYSDDCPCLLETNHGRIIYDSSKETDHVFSLGKHGDGGIIDLVSKSLIEKYNFVTAIESDTGRKSVIREQQIFIVGNGGNVAKVLY